MTHILKIVYLDQDFELINPSQQLTVGRSRKNDLAINEEIISGEHGIIFNQERKYFYKDLNSTNGTIIISSNRADQKIRDMQIELPISGSIFLAGTKGPKLDFSIHKTDAEHDDESASYDLSYFTKGLEAFEAKDYMTALNNFEIGIENSPEDIDLYYFSGFAAFRLKKYHEALLRFEQYLMIRNEDSDVMTDLGKVYEKIGLTQKAVHWYHKAIKTGNNCFEAENQLKNIDRFDTVKNKPSVKYKTIDLLANKEPSIYKAPHFNVKYTADHLDILKSVLKNLEIAYKSIGDFLGVFPKDKIPVTLEPNPYEPHGITSPEGIRLYISSESVGEKKFLPVLIKHEYSHYALGVLTEFSENIPWWVHEGFAQLMSQNITPGRLHHIKGLAKLGNLLPLDKLEQGLSDLDNEEILRVAYFESHAAILYFNKNFGSEKMRKLFKSFTIKRSPDIAFKEVNLDYSKFQKDFSNWLINSSKKGQIRLTQKLY